MAKKSSGKSSGGSFLDKLFGSLFGGNDPDAAKKRQLKAIAKNLAHSKYKFYKTGSDQVLPSFGKFFFDIYKAIGPCQLMFQNQENQNQMKKMVVEYSLSEQQRQLAEELSEESIKAMAAHMSPKEVKAKIKQSLELFNSEFDSIKITAIDALYAKTMAFKSFCQYDFYFMLKKFDSSIREQEFSRSPKFDPIDASYIAEDLKDFVAVIAGLPMDTDWTDMLQMFKTIRGVEPVKPVLWGKIIARLRALQASGIFDMMIQLITKDPFYKTVTEDKHEQIVEAYIDKIQKEATDAVKKLEADQQHSKIDSLLSQIFNTTTIVVLKGYTEQGSAAYEKRNLGSFEYAAPLNYLKAFLVEYVKRDVREYADMVLIRGQWTTNPLSQQMSDAFHNLMGASDKITAFDERMAEDGAVGIKLKTLLPRTERDKEAAGIVRTVIGDANDEAKDYIASSARDLVTFAKNVKMLLEDYQKKNPEMITNWKELDRFAEHPLQELGVEVYKKIYLLVTLLQNYLTNTSS
ncbi:MAG: DUF5312 family protein [Treponema sp.]|nr:DUF5312 family protein [Treponema sp.]